jgi:hypothetical protein
LSEFLTCRSLEKTEIKTLSDNYKDIIIIAEKSIKRLHILERITKIYWRKFNLSAGLKLSTELCAKLSGLVCNQGWVSVLIHNREGIQAGTF